MSIKAPEFDSDQELELLLEAARRANWEAQHGPAYLRAGRFFISEALNAHAQFPRSDEQVVDTEK